MNSDLIIIIIIQQVWLESRNNSLLFKNYTGWKISMMMCFYKVFSISVRLCNQKQIVSYVMVLTLVKNIHILNMLKNFKNFTKLFFYRPCEITATVVYK